VEKRREEKEGIEWTYFTEGELGIVQKGGMGAGMSKSVGWGRWHEETFRLLHHVKDGNDSIKMYRTFLGGARPRHLMQHEVSIQLFAALLFILPNWVGLGFYICKYRGIDEYRYSGNSRYVKNHEDVIHSRIFAVGRVTCFT
jgi:hypothetical protein